MPEAAESFDQVSARVRGALSGGPPRRLAGEGLRRAAVLVAILRRRPQATVLLTRRSQQVDIHKGEIALPGGRVEADETVVQAALREAAEEAGLPGSVVEVVGTLDDQLSVSGYAVTPVVGLVAAPPRLHPQESEVGRLFEVPLALLARRERYHLRPVGRRMAVFFEAAGQHDGPIWGLTARVLMDLAERLGGA